MKESIVMCVALAVIGVGVCHGADVNDVKPGVLKRAGLIKNVLVVYDVNSVITPTQAASKMSKVKSSVSVTVAAEGTKKSQNRFCYLDGKARYESRTGGEPASVIYTLPGGVREELIEHRDGSFSPQITRMLYPADDAIDAALGLQYNRALADRDFKNKCTIAKAEGGKFAVTFDISDDVCEKWVLDADKGYVPVLWEFIVKGQVGVRTVMSDLRKIDEVWAPYKVVSVTYDKEADGKVFESVRREFTVTSVELNSPENTPALYHIIWPAGEKPVDMTGDMDKTFRARRPQPVAPAESPKKEGGN